MDADNLRHWEALSKTDRSHTKPFDNGRFKGTATKPIYNERRLTEHFGPCGIGWGMDKPEFSLVPADNELLVFCTVSLWYRDGETTAAVYGVGGDKVIRVEKRGPFISDEAYKAAFTDALGNAMKHIGVNADIHSGEFDKYGRSEAGTPEPPPRQPTAMVTTSPNNKPAEVPTTKPAPVREPSRPSIPPTAAATSQNGGERLSQIRDRIKRALSLANDRLLPDKILEVNRDDLAAIKQSAPNTYDRLIAYSEQRKTEIAGAANDDL